MYCYRHPTLSGTFHSSPHGKDWTIDDWKMFFFQYAILRVAVWYPDVFVISQHSSMLQTISNILPYIMKLLWTLFMYVYSLFTCIIYTWTLSHCVTGCLTAPVMLFVKSTLQSTHVNNQDV